MQKAKRLGLDIPYHKYRKEEKKKAKAKKVRLNLDKYHKELGGIFNKKVSFYCMPDGRTRIAIRKFEEYDPQNALFITITEDDKKPSYGIVFNKDQDIVIDGRYSFITIDGIHLLSTKKIISILNQFRSRVKVGELLCFGTNADKNGKPITGALLLEEVCDEVIYDTSFPCYSCGEYGRTSFTKTLFEKICYHETDCGVPERYLRNMVDEEGYYCNTYDEDGNYFERDFCFNCREYMEN